MFAIVTPKLCRRRLRFCPAWWAIDFPLAARVNAALRYATAVSSEPLLLLATLLLGATSLALAVLVVRTLRMVVSGEPQS